MKAFFALFLIIAIIGMAMAGVHHYKVTHEEVASAQHSGSIFDAAANGLNNLATGVGNFFG